MGKQSSFYTVDCVHGREEANALFSSVNLTCTDVYIGDNSDIFVPAGKENDRVGQIIEEQFGKSCWYLGRIPPWFLQ